MYFPYSFFKTAVSVKLLKNIFAYYKFDATGLLNDSFGSNILTTSGSPTTSSGLINEALNIGTGNPNPNDVNQTNFDTSTSFTICGWIFTGNFTTEPMISGPNFTVFITSGGKIEFEMTTASFGPLIQVISNETITVSTWTFMAIWFDAVSLTANIELNGSGNPASTSYGANLPSNNGSGFKWNNIFFLRLFDEFGLWNRILNLKERKALYNNGMGLPFSSFTH